MNTNSRFAGVSRAARALLGGSALHALDTTTGAVPPVQAAEDPTGDPADPPAPPAEDEEDEAGVTPPAPAPEEEQQPEQAAADPAPPAPALSAEAQIRADERARVATVFACEHCTGRERQAADMLQTSMSTDEITGLLAKSPKGSAAADPMLAALVSTQNPQLGAGAETPAADSKSADAIWDRVRPQHSKR
ncbi:hypothetical protein [Sphingomonas sp. NFR15]|uniref:hypothetical protein n=1 Tax=Sphingomonas sp. NFR15 TaxID=1566282 RepID=UPI00088B0954|nr:hypothetical protein [Sphingomonas sp. NFR15]SDA14987.1 hypothetical protein SAMN03159340_00623 [Sphingomonas sp. NFR15]